MPSSPDGPPRCVRSSWRTWTGPTLSASIDALVFEGASNAIAVVALPNPAAMARHDRPGFRTVGVLDGVGFELGRRWSTAILQRALI